MAEVGGRSQFDVVFTRYSELAPTIAVVRVDGATVSERDGELWTDYRTNVVSVIKDLDGRFESSGVFSQPGGATDSVAVLPASMANLVIGDTYLLFLATCRSDRTYPLSTRLVGRQVGGRTEFKAFGISLDSDSVSARIQGILRDRRTTSDLTADEVLAFGRIQQDTREKRALTIARDGSDRVYLTAVFDSVFTRATTQSTVGGLRHSDVAPVNKALNVILGDRSRWPDALLANLARNATGRTSTVVFRLRKQDGKHDLEVVDSPYAITEMDLANDQVKVFAGTLTCEEFLEVDVFSAGLLLSQMEKPMDSK